MGNQLDFGVVPRNKEQSFAYELLFDTDIPLVSLIGKEFRKDPHGHLSGF